MAMDELDNLEIDNEVEDTEPEQPVNTGRKLVHSARSANDAIENYYKGTIYSDTLTGYRKKFFKEQPKRPDSETSETSETDSGEKPKKRFRLFDKPEPKNDELLDNNMNPTFAELAVGAIDYGSDKVIEYFTNYNVTDSEDLKEKRKMISKQLAELFDKWGWRLSKEAGLLVLLGVYCSAKSRHLVVKDGKPKTETKEPPKIIQMNTVKKPSETTSKTETVTEAEPEKKIKKPNQGLVNL